MPEDSADLSHLFANRHFLPEIGQKPDISERLVIEPLAYGAAADGRRQNQNRDRFGEVPGQLPAERQTRIESGQLRLIEVKGRFGARNITHLVYTQYPFVFHGISWFNFSPSGPIRLACLNKLPLFIFLCTL